MADPMKKPLKDGQAGEEEDEEPKKGCCDKFAECIYEYCKVMYKICKAIVEAITTCLAACWYPIKERCCRCCDDCNKQSNQWQNPAFDEDDI